MKLLSQDFVNLTFLVLRQKSLYGRLKLSTLLEEGFGLVDEEAQILKKLHGRGQAMRFQCFPLLPQEILNERAESRSPVTGQVLHHPRHSLLWGEERDEGGAHLAQGGEGLAGRGLTRYDGIAGAT